MDRRAFYDEKEMENRHRLDPGRHYLLFCGLLHRHGGVRWLDDVACEFIREFYIINGGGTARPPLLATFQACRGLSCISAGCKLLRKRIMLV